MGGDFLEGEFFWGPLLLVKTGAKNLTQEFGPKFGRPEFVSQVQNPVQKCVPERVAENWFAKTGSTCLKGKGKQRTRLFVAQNGPFGTPFLKVYVCPLFAFFPLRKNSKTQSSLTLLQPAPRNFLK